MDEPRPVPPYLRHLVIQTQAYCLICQSTRRTAEDIRMHIQSAHPEEESIIAGEQWTWGGHLLVMLYRREEWCDKQIRRFSKINDSLIGPDDFVLEAENG